MGEVDAGVEAKEQARYADAETWFLAALEEAGKFEDPQDPRLATSLNALGTVYDDQGRYAEAEPVHNEPYLFPLHWLCPGCRIGIATDMEKT